MEEFTGESGVVVQVGSSLARRTRLVIGHLSCHLWLILSYKPGSRDLCNTWAPSGRSPAYYLDVF